MDLQSQNFIQDKYKLFYIISKLFLKKPEKEELKYFFSQKNIEEEFEKISTDFSELFLALKKDKSPPPYASFWLGEGKVFGKATEDVLNFYKSADVGMDLENELPDHIGVELKFLSIILYKENEFLKKGELDKLKYFKDLKERFLKEHILNWAINYLEALNIASKSEFYKNLAKLTISLLKNEAQN